MLSSRVRFQQVVPLFLVVALSAISVLSHAAPGIGPVGLGSLYSRNAGQSDFALLVEGHNHFKQRYTQFGIRQYGFGQSRLEVGTGIGVTLSAVSGITLIGIESDERISPHIGVEPFSGRITLNSSDSREGFYEWLPMISAGVQFAAGGCRLLPLLRVGGGIGNLRKTGLTPWLRPAYGAGAHLNCKRADLGLELTRVSFSNTPTDLAAADLAVKVGRSWAFGLRGEALLHLDKNPGIVGSGLFGAPPGERRLLAVIRGRGLSGP